MSALWGVVRSANSDAQKREVLRVHWGAHYHSRENRDSRVSKTWANMLTRCYNPAATRYESWGGRGVKVCGRWRNSFQNFLSDMGLKPTPRHTLDRIDNNGNYEPSNCKWSTYAEQRKNQRSARPQSESTKAKHRKTAMRTRFWEQRTNVKRKLASLRAK